MAYIHFCWYKPSDRESILADVGSMRSKLRCAHESSP